jgi:hypothetical protein
MRPAIKAGLTVSLEVEDPYMRPSSNASEGRPDLYRNGFAKHPTSSPSSARASGRWMLRAGPVQSLLS